MGPAGDTAIHRRVTTFRRTVRRIGTTWRAGGPRGTAAHVLRAVAARLVPTADELGVDPTDVPMRRRPVVHTARVARGPMTIGWVVGPPSAGSGGHTTLFRLIRGLEQRGHRCIIHIHDRHCPGDVETSRNIIDTHFEPMTARVVDAGSLSTSADPSLDALIATSWPTAYVVRNAATGAARGYLVQDFEPWFHPAGSAAALAEATYRFGFHGIFAGRWLRNHLAAGYGMVGDSFDFGVDTGTYVNRERTPRRGVVFYARPCTPRRGFALGLIALELLAERRDDIDIELFGEDLGGMPLPFRCVDHGTLTPHGIDRVFNRCAAGLVLSFTNMSLLPYEMLASGCIPVMNDAVHNRALLDNPFVRYVEPTPEQLAAALEAAVDSPTRVMDARRAAGSVAGRDWDDAVTKVERILHTMTGRTSDATSRQGLLAGTGVRP